MDRTPFQDQSGMDISNLLSYHNSSIVPPRLDPLLGSLGLLPSFDDLTFLDKIVLRDTCWRDALGKGVRRPLRPTRCIVLSGSVLQYVVVLSHTNTPPANLLQCVAVCSTVFHCVTVLSHTNSTPVYPQVTLAPSNPSTYTHIHTRTHTDTHERTHTHTHTHT